MNVLFLILFPQDDKEGVAEEEHNTLSKAKDVIKFVVFLKKQNKENLNYST